MLSGGDLEGNQAAECARARGDGLAIEGDFPAGKPGGVHFEGARDPGAHGTRPGEGQAVRPADHGITGEYGSGDRSVGWQSRDPAGRGFGHGGGFEAAHGELLGRPEGEIDIDGLFRVQVRKVGNDQEREGRRHARGAPAGCGGEQAAELGDDERHADGNRSEKPPGQLNVLQERELLPEPYGVLQHENA